MGGLEKLIILTKQSGGGQNIELMLRLFSDRKSSTSSKVTSEESCKQAKEAWKIM